jgi:hypothetical protein
MENRMELRRREKVEEEAWCKKIEKRQNKVKDE